MAESKNNSQRVLQLWIIAVVLIVSGVLLARLVRAALMPALRVPEMGIELHLAARPPEVGRGSASPLRTKGPLRFRGSRAC